ncbi:MAG: DUF5808 domain-containing protein [Carnobacterium sp.]|uniref:DUF1648 domain-containing protein n=1 Tax=Carnobacterium sp. TaxID=48221 RepID=UPI003C78000A
MGIFISFIIILFLLTSLIIGLMPYTGRKGIEFGVNIPENEDTHLRLAKWRKLYFLINLILGSLFSWGIFLLMKVVNLTQSKDYLSIYILVGMMTIILISSLTYLAIRKKIMKIKNNLFKEDRNKKEKEIVIESNYRNSEIGVPNFILLLSNGIIILTTALITLLYYDQIPSRFPTHWGINFTADRFVDKSFLTTFAVIGIQILLAFIFYLSNYSLIQAKQLLNHTDPSQSSFQNKAYRLAWSRFTLIVSILTQLLLSSVQFTSIIFFDTNISYFIYGIILFTLIILIYTISLTLKYGQSGSRFKKNKSMNKSQFETAYYDDDRYWKLGIVYYNPKDPSIWIEKRFGIGTTTNMARWQSWVIILIITLFCLLPLFFL